MAAGSYFPIVYKTNLLEDVFTIAASVWIVVALAAFFSAVLLYIFTKAEIKNATKLKDNIYQSDKTFCLLAKISCR
jgi:hypothetical protein